MKRKLIFFLAFFEIAKLFAQETGVNVVGQAQDFFEKSYYKESLELLNNYEKNNSLSTKGLFLKALNLYQLNKLALAEEAFSILKVDQEQPPFAEVWLYLAKINHHQHEFEEAARYYKTYLRTIKSDDDLKKSIVEEIRRCSNGKREKYKISGNFVENFGSQVNSNEDEFFPIESGSESTELYFSTMSGKNNGGKREETGKINEWEGRFYSDMYRTTNLGGKWTAPNALHFQLNSPQHEVLIGFNQGEPALYYFRGNTLEGGAIMKTGYSESDDLANKSKIFFSSPWLNIKEGGFQVFDETMVLYAARIPGGYGGLDLYYSIFSEGQWSSPINLGPEINSAFDEAYPFLSSDGKTLFYSTNNSQWSIGGYDILQQVYNKETDGWLSAISMGMPVNSAGDDIQFYLARDGFTGYFTSNRRTGYGKKDLYATYLSNLLSGEKSNYPSFVKSPPKRTVVQKDEPTLEMEVKTEVTGPENQEVKILPKIENSFKEEERVVLKKEVIEEVEEAAEIKKEEKPYVLTEKVEQRPLTKELKKVAANSLELPMDLRSIDMEVAEFLKEVIKEFPNKRNGYVHLTFSVRNRVPLFEHYRQVEHSANQIVQYLIGLGMPSDRIAFHVDLNPTIPNEKFNLKYSWKDRMGLPLENSKSYIEDPFSIRMVDIPFYYKVSLSGASELKNAALINNYPNPTLEVNYEGKVTYSAGQFRTFEAARNFAQQLINNGLTELRVVPYIYDSRAPEESIIQFVHLFPDFSVYLNQNR